MLCQHYVVMQSLLKLLQGKKNCMHKGKGWGKLATALDVQA